MTPATFPAARACPHPRARARTLRRGWWRLLRSRPERGSPPPGAGRAAALPSADGNPGIDALYYHRRLELVRLALLLVDDLPTAEDVVQDAFAALFRKHGTRLRGLDDPEAYLRTSVVNRARSVLRRRRTARAYTPERERHVPPADEHVLLDEEHREVLAALRRLTRRQREVLVLRYWSHLTEAQIADALGLSRGTVKSTASRALDALGRQLGVSR
ncbi:sigma-70 family RNA polymerase sigma factor [Streptomyces sp. WMMC500]|uniref:RNA polymerase sigma factor n=1 Tax=Streptomyces sp. WMMC500 TaxID=3015154 RepID=UPI00248CC3D1|nr:sigma-70 family RNA polymerase sigma factor [Streptomyces sp. WMMC500]WBB63913.1 sigma-70 family RNA polymerase sigma factor [Streptomyces sp. WMMC500]